MPCWATKLSERALFNTCFEDAYKKNSFREAFKSERYLISADCRRAVSEFDTWPNKENDIETAPEVLKHNRGAEPLSFGRAVHG
ncbi:MAG: hypothetical protein AAF468_19185 [Pseudomonadota bacterium]